MQNKRRNIHQYDIGNENKRTCWLLDTYLASYHVNEMITIYVTICNL
jgi:hypothetical protein